MNGTHGTRSALSVLLGIGLLVGVWQAYITATHAPAYTIPTPLSTFRQMGTSWSLLASRSWVTAEGTLVGLGASAAIGVVLGVAIVRWPAAERAVMAYALLVRTLPIVGVAPLLTLIAGRGLLTSVLCVIVITVFSLLVSVVQGLRSLPGELAELSDVYGTPFLRRVRTTLLPAAVGSLVQGFRVAAPLAVLGALLAEWLTGRAGVGSLMLTASAQLDIKLLWADCATAVLLSLLAYAAVSLIAWAGARRGYGVDALGLGEVG
jgi:ABC-type nitrate/sulfonate/bicarbonate transport system permease component